MRSIIDYFSYFYRDRSDPAYRPRPILSQTRRPVKRLRPIHLDSAFHHTYVMKLFDRSVDLAQFEEDTPLYPICRAWMANQPRNPNFAPKYGENNILFWLNLELLRNKTIFTFRARSPSPEIERDDTVTPNTMFDDTGDIRDVLALPDPLPSVEAFPQNRIPSPILFDKEELDLDYVSSKKKK